MPEWCAIFQFSFATLVNSVFIGLLLTSLNIKIFHIANVILICAKRLFRVFGMFTDFKNILWGAIFLRLSVNTKKTKPYSYNLHRLRRRGGSVLFRSYISSPQNPKWAFCLCIFTQTTPPPPFFSVARPSEDRQSSYALNKKKKENEETSALEPKLCNNTVVVRSPWVFFEARFFQTPSPESRDKEKKKISELPRFSFICILYLLLFLAFSFPRRFV